MLAPWKKNYDKSRQIIKNQRRYFADKGSSSQSYGFPVIMYDCESWTIKKAEIWRTDAFKKPVTLLALRKCFGLGLFSVTPVLHSKEMGKKWNGWQILFYWAPKSLWMVDCSHEIKRCLLLGRKTMTNVDSILKSRDITLLSKVCIVKAIVYPVFMYRC